jgi:deoxyribodipyrimidine photolyase-related protein
MSQHADDGLLATKPYCAPGAYIQRVSDYCRSCRFEPKQATDDDACFFTTLYWDFLDRNQNPLRSNQRMNFQLSNLGKKSRSERRQVRRQADALKTKLTTETGPWA